MRPQLLYLATLIILGGLAALTLRSAFPERVENQTFAKYGCIKTDRPLALQRTNFLGLAECTLE